MNQEFTFNNLSHDDVMIILDALSKHPLPLILSSPLYQKLKEQTDRQLNPPEETEQA